MLNSKKIISAILAAAMIAVAPISVCAEDSPDNTQKIPGYTTISNNGAKWTNISTVGAGFRVDGDYGKCTGSYELYSTKKSKITITLMKSSNGRSWSAVESWSTTNSVSSPHNFSKTSTNKLQHGYYYRTFTQVQVYGTDGSVLETGQCESSGTYYA